MTFIISFKKIISTFGIVLLLATTMQAQSPTTTPPDTAGFKARFLKINRQHAIVLGTWAGINIFAGGGLSLISDGSTKYLHQMNAGWGLVNAGIVGFMAYHSRKDYSKPFGVYDCMSRQSHLERVLLLNVGLDAAYMAGGLALTYYGQTPNGLALRDQWTGFGQSILIQGGFLLLQDVVFYALHNRNKRKHFPSFKGFIEGR